MFIDIISSNNVPLVSWWHYRDVIMSTMASQITNQAIVHSNIYSGINQRKHQGSASLAFVRGIHQWPVNFHHKEPVTQKMFPFDDVMDMGVIGGYQCTDKQNKPWTMCNIHGIYSIGGKAASLFINRKSLSLVQIKISGVFRDNLTPYTMLTYHQLNTIVQDLRKYQFRISSIFLPKIFIFIINTSWSLSSSGTQFYFFYFQDLNPTAVHQRTSPLSGGHVYKNNYPELPANCI